jgi:hypothetical protein
LDIALRWFVYVSSRGYTTFFDFEVNVKAAEGLLPEFRCLPLKDIHDGNHTSIVVDFAFGLSQHRQGARQKSGLARQMRRMRTDIEFGAQGAESSRAGRRIEQART